MIIRRVKVSEIYSLRNLVLRPGKPVESTYYDRDHEDVTLHFAGFLRKEVICIATFYPEIMTGFHIHNPYRLRGMATDPNYRRKGYAKKLMEYATTVLKSQHADLIWCKARNVAIPFYQNLGYQILGETYNIDGIGMHYNMYKILT
jgi:predicted GNAT family N-acyltransferase